MRAPILRLRSTFLTGLSKSLCLVLIGLAGPACKAAPAPTVVVAPESTPARTPEEAELAARLGWLSAQLEQARVDTHVPGMAMAIVRGDEVIYAQGFGMSDLEAQTPVTPDTRFAIGSSTKAFASTLVAMMVDEGKLDWDDPIAKHMPEFSLALKDKREDQELTIRDLLSHRSGFARMGLLWAGGKLTRPQALALANKAEAVADFRDQFHYNNVTYMAGSLAAARVAGVSWEALLQTRLLDPLGMTNTNVGYARAQADPQMSKGYLWREDTEVYEQPRMRNLDLIAPAGAINSSVNDMTRWLRFQLAYGEFEGERLVSKRALRDTRRSVLTIGGGVDYGMGWMLREWQEMKVVEHGGNIDGFSASVALLPEKNLGVVLLTNASRTSLQQTNFTTVWRALLTDAYLETPNPLGEELTRFAGAYVPEIPGFAGERFVVTAKGGRLFVAVPGQMDYALAPPDDDAWREFEVTDEVAVSFEEDEAGEVISLVLHQSGMSMEMLREGVQRKAEVDPEDPQVRGVLGHYAADGDARAEVLVRNGRLVFDVDKQMPFDLAERESDDEYHFRANYEMFLVFDEGKTKKGKPAQATGLTMFEQGKTRKFKRVPAPVKVTPAQVHKLRRSEARQKALEAAGIVRLEQKIEIRSAGIVATNRAWFDAAGRLRQETDYGDAGALGSGLVVLDGKGGGRSESSFEAARVLDGVLLQQAELGHPAVSIGDWRSRFKDAPAVRVRKTEGGELWELGLEAPDYPQIQVFVDAKTGDLVKMRGFETTASGVRMPVTTKYSDFREVGGLRIAFRMEVSNEESGTIVVQTSEVVTQVPEARARFFLSASP